VRPGDGARDRQAQSETAAVAVSRVVEADETLEDVIPVGVGDARPVVDDVEVCRAAHQRGPPLDCSVRPGSPGCVRQEVGQHGAGTPPSGPSGVVLPWPPAYMLSAILLALFI